MWNLFKKLVKIVFTFFVILIGLTVLAFVMYDAPGITN